MPNFICQACYTQLEKNHQFRLQIEQSDRTLRRCIQNLRLSGKQIKTEYFEDILIHSTNADSIVKSQKSTHRADVFSNCENSSEEIKGDIHDVNTNQSSIATECGDTKLENFSMNNDCEVRCKTKNDFADTKIIVNQKEKQCEKFNSEAEAKNEGTSNFVIKNEPMDDSLISAERADDPVATFALDGCYENSCEDTMNDFRDSKTFEFVNVSWKEKQLEYFNAETKVKQEIEIKNEPMNDWPVSKKRPEDTLNTFSSWYDHEIRNEDTEINIDHTLGNFERHCSADLSTDFENRLVSKKPVEDTLSTSSSWYHNEIRNEDSKIDIDHTRGNFENHCSTNLITDFEKREEGSKTTSVDTEFHKKPRELEYTGFPDPSSLNNHSELSTDKQSYQCDVCNKCFAFPSHLTIHKRSHTGEKPYRCEFCNKHFSQSHKLKVHKRLHTGEKPYQCDVCDEHFSLPRNLKKHKLLHTGEKPYQCDVCDKWFDCTSNLRYHKRTHTGEKPYKCDVCSKRFALSCTLNVHKRTHVGEKRYTCDLCNKAYTSITSLNDHKRTHTGEKPYQCDLCNKRFTALSNFNTHKRRHIKSRHVTKDS